MYVGDAMLLPESHTETIHKINCTQRTGFQRKWRHREAPKGLHYVTLIYPATHEKKREENATI